MEARRERYTPNDIGPSPADWRAPRLEEVSSLITNGFVGTATPFYCVADGVTYLYGTNVRENKIDLAGVRMISREFHRDQQKTELQAGDLLTVQSGHIGTTAVVPKELEGANCHALIVTRLHKDRVDPNFMSAYLNSHIGKSRLRGLHVGSTILHINTKDLKRFRVPLPPLAEQSRISEILSTWDRAIEAVEKLIKKDTVVYQSIAQRLLSKSAGEIPSQNYRKASEIFQAVSIRNNGSEQLLAVTQEHGVIPRDALDRRVVMPGGETGNYKLVVPGNFVISLRSFQGGFEYSRHRGTVSPAYTVLEPKVQICDEFYRHYFKSREFIGRLAVAVIGIRDGKQISYSDFSFLELPSPDLQDQQRIAERLSTAERLVNCLVEYRKKLVEEKTSLMQRLLTGNQRVKADREVDQIVREASAHG